VSVTGGGGGRGEAAEKARLGVAESGVHHVRSVGKIKVGRGVWLWAEGGLLNSSVKHLVFDGENGIILLPQK
jgi:hypothetical protein